MDFSSDHPSPRALDPRRIEVIDLASTAVLQKMTGGQRVMAACRLFSSTRTMLRRQLAAAHLDWTPEQLDRELARRISGGAV
jgi:hypothetical protein